MTGLLTTPWEAPPNPGEVIEVADGVLWARLPLPMALDHVNVYFLREADGWTMVDAGLATGTSRKLLAQIEQTALSGAPITRILLTHHHPDHAGLAGDYVRRGAELLTTRSAYLLTRMLTLDVEPVPPAETLAFWHRNGMDKEVLEARKTERPFNFADCVVPLPLGYTRIQAGETLRLGGRDWHVAVGHGHAPEHAVLFERGGDHLVLGGDQLLPSISPNIGVYPAEPDADPIGEWLASCENLAAFANEQQLVLPGHKLPYRGLPTRLRQLAENHHGALRRLEEHLETPQIGGACFAPLFKRKVTPAIYGLAFVETIAHLNHLYQTGRALRRLDESGVYQWQRIRPDE